MSFIHQDASGVSLRETNETGGVPYGRQEAEYDALGNNVGLYNPYVSSEPPPDNPGIIDFGGSPYGGGGGGKLIKKKASDQINQEPPEVETRYSLRSTVLGGEVITEVGATGSVNRFFVRANGTVVATQENGTSWSHKDLNLNSIRSTDASGQIIGDGSGTSDTDKFELDPMGKNVEFSDPYVGGTPAPLTDYLSPFPFYENFRDGNLTSYTVDGVRVPASYFSQMTEFAFGGMFGLVEHQSRMSQQIVGYRTRSGYLTRAKSRTPPRIRQGGTSTPPAQTPTDEEDEGLGRWTTRDPIYNSNWAGNLLLIAFSQQSQTKQKGFNLGNKGVAFTAEEKSMLNKAFEHVNSKKCLDWINQFLAQYINPWLEGGEKGPEPFALSAEHLLSKVTLNRYSSSLTAAQMGFGPGDRAETTKKENISVGVTQRSTPSIFLFKRAFYQPEALVSFLGYEGTDLPASIVHEMLHAFGLEDPFVRSQNAEIQKNCGWGGHVAD